MDILKGIKNKIYFLYSFFVHYKWTWGFESRKTWKTKSYFSAGMVWYDGPHYYLHLGWFYVCVN